MTTAAQSLLNALLEDDIINKGYISVHYRNGTRAYDTDGSMDLDTQYIDLY